MINPRRGYALILVATTLLWHWSVFSLQFAPRYSYSRSQGTSLTSMRSQEERLQVSTRVQKIKDMYVTKEVLNDVTAAEFALIVDMRTKEDKIDYNMLISRLDNDLARLISRGIEGDAELGERIKELKLSLSKKFHDGVEVDDTPKNLIIPPPTQSKNDLSSEKESLPSLRILVREDGTIDWDDAIASSREVAKFGTELWERLNGKEEGLPSISELFGQVAVKLPVTEEIAKLESLVNSTQGILIRIAEERDRLRNQLVVAKKAGNEISPSDLQALRALDIRLKDQEKRLKLLKLDLDMEQICVCLEQDVQTASDPSDQKLIVAQVALIERQLRNIMTGLPPLDKQSINDDYSEEVSLSALVDDDELALVIVEVNSHNI